MYGPIETIESGDRIVKIYCDDSSESPREWDNLGTMALYHGRYCVAQESEFGEPRELVEEMQKNGKKYIALPVFMYDHSGVALSTGRQYPFNCPWDSGQLGWIFVTREQVRKEWKVQRISPKLRAQVENILRGEVETYGAYLNGNVYGYVAEDQDGEHLDSCWGFYGFDFEENGLYAEAGLMKEAA